MNESLLLTSRVIEFRNTYPELIAQWERQIGKGNRNPNLNFCFNLLDSFPKLRAYLAMLEYRIDFAINTYIFHSNWQREFIESGHDNNLALELANYEIQLTYKALNEPEDIAEDSKVKVYHDILMDENSNDF